MRYTITKRNGTSPMRNLLTIGRVYDDRTIFRLISGKNLTLTRPNGDSRYRGSRVLHVNDGSKNPLFVLSAEL